MSVIWHGKHLKSLFTIYKRPFCSQQSILNTTQPIDSEYDETKTTSISHYLLEPQPTNYNTALMESSQLKKMKASKTTTKSRNITNKLRNKYQIQLPVHISTKQAQQSQETKEFQPLDVFENKSQLLHKFNEESNIYIRGNTEYINRKYEPLIEQVNNIKSLDDASQHTAYDHGNDTDYMRNDMNCMENDDFETEKTSKVPMKLHKQWNLFFRGDDSQALYNEAETWNVMAHINKRYSYGKSLRYSDRFYRNWAIQVAKQEDEKFQQGRIEHARKNSDTEPKDASQLQAYVKKNANLANLSFKDANALYKANKGKGKVGGGDAGGGASESKEAEPSGASNPLFAQLNQGGNITKGLKKVTRDMTNKDKKISGKIADSNKPKSSGPPKKKAAANKPKKVKPPAIRKQGFRIWVENFVEGVEEIKEAGLKNEVYIVNCRDAGFSLPNKCKAVIVDSCSKIQVEIDSVLTSVDLINTKSCTLYLKSNVPTLNVDKSASPRIVLFQALLDNNPQIVTSMTSDMNISVPGIDEDADFKDVPVPYQFITTVDPETKEVRTVPMQHTG